MARTTKRPMGPMMLGRARQLRQEMSPVEQRVWGMLRNGHIAGLRFRRQHPVGAYVVDFYCHACQLIIEVDGPSHLGQEACDAERRSRLTENGYRVIQFSNHDVLTNPDGVREAICEACRTAGPSPVPAAAGGGGTPSPEGRGETTSSAIAEWRTPFHSPLPSGGVVPRSGTGAGLQQRRFRARFTRDDRAGRGSKTTAPHSSLSSRSEHPELTP
jgi:very-short-patch-repair endonuclease